MSILALTGQAPGSFGGGHGRNRSPAPTDPQSTPRDRLTLDLNGKSIPRAELPETLETLDFERGALVSGFDPARDVLELEYSAALGAPEVTITDFPDGTGASVALNGVVVADVRGAQGLPPQAVILKPV